jgi:hydrogenase small subunit
VHEVCPRAGYFASGKFSEEFGEPYCMGLLGCKGVISHCSVPRDGFTEGFGGCPSVGSPCIGCVEPEFPDAPYSPFLKKGPAWEFTKEAFKDTWGHVYALFHRLKRRRI